MSIEGSNFQKIATSLEEIAKRSDSDRPNKSYLSIRRGELSVEVGKSAKKSKNLNANKLSKLIHNITEKAIQNDSITNDKDLSAMVKGLEVLKGRVSAHQDKISPTKKFLMELFNIKDKSQIVIDRMDETIAILQEYSREKDGSKQPPQTQVISPSVGRKKEIETLATIFGLDPTQTNFRANVENRINTLSTEKDPVIKEVHAQALASLNRLKSYESALRQEKTENKAVSKNKTHIVVPVKTPAKTKANMLLERIAAENTPQSKKARQIQSFLGYTLASSAYLDYQQKLIFGFSVGQRQAIDELQKHGITTQNLKNMLEGGDDITNMFYLANSIEELIANPAEKSPQYIQKLEIIHADLMRSLPLALETNILDKQIAESQSEMVARIRKQQSPIEAKTAALSLKIQNQLKEMNAGESLYIPVGTKNHAIILRLEKTSDGKVLPSLYNTGLGASSHQDFWNQLSNLFKEHNFSPIKVSYPAFSLTENFESKLGGIFTNRMKNDSVDQLYVKAKEKLGIPQPGPSKKEQINGVCTFQVLTAILEDNLEESEHNQFQHDFLTRLGNEFSTIRNELKITTSIAFDNANELTDKEKTATVKNFYNAMLEDNSREIHRLKQLIEATRIK
jgi:hypothetical protein